MVIVKLLFAGPACFLLPSLSFSSPIYIQTSSHSYCQSLLWELKHTHRFCKCGWLSQPLLAEFQAAFHSFLQHQPPLPTSQPPGRGCLATVSAFHWWTGGCILRGKEISWIAMWFCRGYQAWRLRTSCNCLQRKLKTHSTASLSQPSPPFQHPRKFLPTDILGQYL